MAQKSMKAVRIQDYGGPEALEIVEVPIPQPCEGQGLPGQPVGYLGVLLCLAQVVHRDRFREAQVFAAGGSVIPTVVEAPE
jgi:hypothetical protein